MTADIIVHGLAKVTTKLHHAAAGAVTGVRAVTEEASIELTALWRAKARITAGKHGKLYPSTIGATEVPRFGAVVFRIEPDQNKRQGGMGRGFEYGSVNQPPHMDAHKAVAETGPKFAAAIELAAKGLL